MHKNVVWGIQSKWYSAVILFIFSCMASPCFATVPCVTVGPSATGNGTGADWNDVKALPGSSGWAYGTRYYLQDGTYGQFTIGTPSGTGSPTNVVEVRKAQSYDYGRSSDGCTTDVSAGWNASTMGAAQAVFPWKGGDRFFNGGTAGYITINGNPQTYDSPIGCGGVYANPPGAMTGAAPTPSGCGIKFDGSTCTLTTTDGCEETGMIYAAGPNYTFEGMEWKGSGQNSNGNNNQEPYYMWAQNTTGMVVTHSFLHNFGTTCITSASGGWSNATFTHNYVWGSFDGSVNHGECIQLQAGSDSNSVVANNFFRDMIDNGIVVGLTVGQTGTHTGFQFYNNINWCSSGNTCRHNDGFVGCYQTENCTGWIIVNNVEVGYTTNAGVVFSTAPTVGPIIENNLFYNNTSAFSIPSNATEDYNTFLNSGSPGTGSHDVYAASSPPDPWTNWPSGLFTLVSANSDWSNRVDLTSTGSQYQSDFAGNPFVAGGSRGAYQYGTTTPTGPAAPTNLTATPH